MRTRILFSFLFTVLSLPATTLVTYLTPGVGVDALPISPVRVANDQFQEVYSSSLFGSSKVTLISIAFSSSAHTGSSDASTLSGAASLTLSTTGTLTPGSPGSWSLANEGVDKQTVYSGYFSTSVLHNATFDIVFTFSSPFVFDPSAGNLLLNFTWTTSPSTNGGLNLSASYGSSLVGSNSNTAQYGSYGAPDTGAATQFGVAPEPGSWLLGGSALLCCVWLVRRSRKPRTFRNIRGGRCAW